MSADVIVKADIDLAKILDAINNVGNKLSSLATTIKNHDGRLENIEGKVRDLEINQVELKAFGKDIKSLNTNVNDLLEDVERLCRKQAKNSFVLEGGVKILMWLGSLVIAAYATWLVTS